MQHARFVDDFHISLVCLHMLIYHQLLGNLSSCIHKVYGLMNRRPVLRNYVSA